MKKLQLKLDALDVVSFEASAADTLLKGTVQGNMATPACTPGCSVDITCDNTCQQVPSCRIIC